MRNEEPLPVEGETLGPGSEPLGVLLECHRLGVRAAMALKDGAPFELTGALERLVECGLEALDTVRDAMWHQVLELARAHVREYGGELTEVAAEASAALGVALESVSSRAGEHEVESRVIARVAELLHERLSPTLRRRPSAWVRVRQIADLIGGEWQLAHGEPPTREQLVEQLEERCLDWAEAHLAREGMESPTREVVQAHLEESGVSAAIEQIERVMLDVLTVLVPMNAEASAALKEALSWSEEEVLVHSCGRIRDPHTLELDTGELVEGGLACEQVFGPLRELSCRCGKLSGPEHLDQRCPECGVECGLAGERAVRVGHIELAGPVYNAVARRTVSHIAVIGPGLRPSSGAASEGREESVINEIAHECESSAAYAALLRANEAFEGAVGDESSWHAHKMQRAMDALCALVGGGVGGTDEGGGGPDGGDSEPRNPVPGQGGLGCEKLEPVSAEPEARAVAPGSGQGG